MLLSNIFCGDAGAILAQTASALARSAKLP